MDAGPNDFYASFGGDVLYSYVDDNTQPTTYTEYSFTDVPGTGASTVLQFEFRNDPSYQGLDDIIVTQVATAPDVASTFGLLGTALAGLTMLRRKLA